MSRRSLFIYAIYDKEDNIIDVFDNINEILKECYKFDKNNIKYWQKYRQIWNSLEKNKNHCIKPRNYWFLIYRIVKDDS